MRIMDLKTLQTEMAYSSLSSYAAHPVVNITIMLLIVIGGIGFLTWQDIRLNIFYQQNR